MKKSIAPVLCRPLILILPSGCLAWSQAKQERAPIIDMHLHALKVSEFALTMGTQRQTFSYEGSN